MSIWHAKAVRGRADPPSLRPEGEVARPEPGTEPRRNVGRVRSFHELRLDWPFCTGAAFLPLPPELLTEDLCMRCSMLVQDAEELSGPISGALPLQRICTKQGMLCCACMWQGWQHTCSSKGCHAVCKAQSHA